MPDETNIPSAFSTQNPNLQLAWSSTALGWLKTCPRLYQYCAIEGYSSPFQAVDLEFGLFFATANETYNKLRAKGLDHQAALIITLREAILNTWNFDLSRPWLSDNPNKTRRTLLRTIVWYFDHFADDPLTTHVSPDGKPSVELAFHFALTGDNNDNEFRAYTGETFSLCGHIDRVVEWNEGLWVLDNKTTKYELDDNYFRQYTPDNQVSLYDIAGMVILGQQIDGLIIDGTQILVNGNRFRRREIERTEDQRNEWMIDLRIWLKQAELYAQLNHFPQNEKSCGFGNRQCMFRKVCSSDPSAREDLLKTHYTKTPFNPLQPR